MPNRDENDAAGLQTLFPWRRALLLALGAGVVLTAATWLAARLLGVEASFQTLADQVTLWLPPKLFSFILFHLQHWAKPLFLVGLAGAWAALGAFLALAASLMTWRNGASRHARVATAVALALLLWVLSAAVLSPLGGNGIAGSGSSGGALRWSVAALLPALLFGWLVWAQRMGREVASLPPSKKMAKEFNRRDFLTWTGSGLIVLAGSTLLAKDVLRLSKGAVGPGTSGENSGGGAGPVPSPVLESQVTPTEKFYVVSKNFSDPGIDVQDWSLRVGGLVDHPMRLSYADVTALPSRREHVTLECISNEIGGDQIGNALWTGVPLQTLIERAGPQPGAAFVFTKSEDGYSESLPMATAMDPDVFLAYEMNGAPLLKAHGFPLRLLVPGRYGMKSTKWLTEIELSAKDRQGYWEQRGWDQPAVVKTMSRIDYPRDGLQVPLGPVTVAGIAFAGRRGVQRVELNANGGTWQEASIEPALSTYTWVRWSFVWDPPGKGRYTLRVRATDVSGQVQTGVRADDYPDGATGYHSVSVRVG